MSRAPIPAWHNRHYNNGDEETSENKEDADAVQVGHGAVEKADEQACDPRGNDVRHKNMPWLRDEVCVLQGVPGAR